MQVAPNTIVSLRYCMKNSNGDVLEDRMHTTPVEYLHGSSSILPALQNGLTGLAAGAETHEMLQGQQGLLLDDDFYFDVVIDGVRPATEEEIKTGKPAKPVVDEDCGDDCIC